MERVDWLAAIAILALGFATGATYAWHIDSRPVVVHRDIKPENVIQADAWSLTFVPGSGGGSFVELYRIHADGSCTPGAGSCP